jgi:ankyrin repeat protein
VKTFVGPDGTLTNGATRDQLESGFLYACGYGCLDVARYLLDAGVDPNVATRQGQTSLHWVAYGPHVEVARLLLERGARTNVRDQAGRTPLDWAEACAAGARDPEDVSRARQLVDLLRRASSVS